MIKKQSPATRYDKDKEEKKMKVKVLQKKLG